MVWLCCSAAEWSCLFQNCSSACAFVSLQWVYAFIVLIVLLFWKAWVLQNSLQYYLLSDHVFSHLLYPSTGWQGSRSFGRFLLSVLLVYCRYIEIIIGAEKWGQVHFHQSSLYYTRRLPPICGSYKSSMSCLSYWKAVDFVFPALDDDFLASVWISPQTVNAQADCGLYWGLCGLANGASAHDLLDEEHRVWHSSFCEAGGVLCWTAFPGVCRILRLAKDGWWFRNFVGLLENNLEKGHSDFARGWHDIFQSRAANDAYHSLVSELNVKLIRMKSRKRCLPWHLCLV